MRRAATLLCELERAAQRLERLAEGRRERLRDLARLRALEDETSQVRTPEIACLTFQQLRYYYRPAKCLVLFFLFHGRIRRQ